MLPLIPSFHHHKLQPKSIPYVFLGYPTNYKTYICYDYANNKFIISCNVQFQEKIFPYHNTPSSKPIIEPLLQPSPTYLPLLLLIPTTQPANTSPSPHTSPPSEITPTPPLMLATLPINTSNSYTSTLAILCQPPQSHHMVTQTKTGSLRPWKIFSLVSLMVDHELHASMLDKIQA